MAGGAGTGPASTHQVGAVDQEDHQGDGAHRRQPDLQGAAARQRARPYSEQITEVIRNLAAAGRGRASPLLEQREEIGTVAFVVVAGDRGLCGGYNTNVIRAAERADGQPREQGKQTRLITVGKKATGYFRFRGYEIDASHVGFSDEPTYEDARPGGGGRRPPLRGGRVRRRRAAPTRSSSPPACSAVLLKRFVPLETDLLDSAEKSDGPSADYEFEPGPGEILDRLLPRYAEARLYAALLEGSASRSSPPSSAP